MNIFKIDIKSGVPIVLFTALTGCGNIANVRSFCTAYQPPVVGERAKIRVISDGMVRGVPESSCVDWRKTGAGVLVVPQVPGQLEPVLTIFD